MKYKLAKLRETLLINFYKRCNASCSFSNAQCGCHFLLKKGKKHEEQICNSTEQFLILKTLTAFTCSKVLHHSSDLGEKRCQLLTLSLDSWATTTTCAAHILRALASLNFIWRSVQARMLHSFFNGPSRYVHAFSALKDYERHYLTFWSYKSSDHLKQQNLTFNKSEYNLKQNIYQAYWHRPLK